MKIFKLNIPPILPTALFILTAILFASCNKQAGDEYTVLRGNFVQSITEAGELQSMNASSITMPNISYQYGYNFKLIGLMEHGSTVHKGDSVAALDPSSIYRYIINREESLENVKAMAEKMNIEAESSIRELEVELKNELAAYELKQLELERIQFESDMKKKVKELEFRQSEIKLEKVKRNLRLKPEIEQYDIRINNLSIMQHEMDLESAHETLKKLTLYSPGNGLFQLNENRRNGQITKLGDEIYVGALIASIPDISRMKTVSYVNEADISKISPGMKVIVRLDALPNVEFNGLVKEISKICTEKEKEKIFTTEIEILESDTRLKPGMSVSCEYICYEAEDEMYVPNSCLLKEKSHAYVFLKKGGAIEKTEVIAGASNSGHTVIKSDLRAGRRLVPVNEVVN